MPERPLGEVIDQLFRLGQRVEIGRRAMMTDENPWISCADQLPVDGMPVMTKIDDADGCRNEQVLIRRGRLWFFPDETMYVYYVPNFWRPIEASKD